MVKSIYQFLTNILDFLSEHLLILVKPGSVSSMSTVEQWDKAGENHATMPTKPLLVPLQNLPGSIPVPAFTLFLLPVTTGRSFVLPHKTNPAFLTSPASKDFTPAMTGPYSYTLSLALIFIHYICKTSSILEKHLDLTFLSCYNPIALLHSMVKLFSIDVFVVTLSASSPHFSLLTYLILDYNSTCVCQIQWSYFILIASYLPHWQEGVPVLGLGGWLDTTFRAGWVRLAAVCYPISSQPWEEDAAHPISPHNSCAREHSDKQGQWEAGFIVSRGWGTSGPHRRMWLACWRISDIVHTNNGDCVHVAFLTVLSMDPGFALHCLAMSSENPSLAFWILNVGDLQYWSFQTEFIY